MAVKDLQRKNALDANLFAKLILILYESIINNDLGFKEKIMNTAEDIDYVLDVLPPTVERMREIVVRR